MSTFSIQLILINHRGITVKPNDVKEFYGTGYNFHKETGLSHVSLTNWIKWGFVPENSQYKLERITDGALKADDFILHKDKLTIEESAFRELKQKMIALMFRFTDKYGSRDVGLYPKTGYILINVLEECLRDARQQMEGAP
jgi:hypothetical protein